MNRFLTLLIAAVVFTAAQSVRAQTNAAVAGYQYLSPVPGASYVASETRFLLVRFKEVAPGQITNLASFVSVKGKNSGAHPGTTRIASDGKTVIFENPRNFYPNELVTVTLTPGVGSEAAGHVDPFEYQFMISAPMPGSLPATPAPPTVQAALAPPPDASMPQLNRAAPGGSSRSMRKTAAVMTNGVSVPSDFPQVLVSVNNNPAPGYLFLENGLGGIPPYTMILDNNGSPVWYRRGRMYDFKIQQNGLITWCLQEGGGYPAFDQNFNPVRTYNTANGYLSDGHELQVMKDGSYFILGYRLNMVDLSKYIQGASTRASVRETVIQEFTAADELVFQWRAWDNYDIRDTGTDFPHMNSIALDDDGQLLVSSRHLSEITKINCGTGEIIWRLGGPHSQFTFVNDPFNGFSYQHSISALGGGRYLLFDNGNNHVPQVSRAVQYQLDLQNRRAVTTWQFRDAPDRYTQWLGNAQRLSSGNTLVNFVRAEYPKAIEVDSSGVKHFELSLTPGSDAYRAFRFPWQGVVSAPYLVVEPQPDNVTLIFNKFGDTNVAFYRIYAGTSPEPDTVLTTSTEPLARLRNLDNGTRWFLRVTAVSRDGDESEFSNEESVVPNITKPGQNFVVNSDFSLGAYGWALSVLDYASAGWTATNGLSQFAITNGGAMLASIRLAQGQLPLVQGQKYAFEFDAWAGEPRYVQARVSQTESPYINYSANAASFLTPIKTHFRYTFTMIRPTDLNASVMFDVGSYSSDVYLQNVALFMLAPGDSDANGVVDFQDLKALCDQWLKPAGAADLNGDKKINFQDLQILGENWSAAEPEGVLKTTESSRDQ